MMTMGIRENDAKDFYPRYAIPTGGFLAVVALLFLIRVCFVANDPDWYIGLPGDHGLLIILSVGLLAFGFWLLFYGIKNMSHPGMKLYRLTHFRRLR